MAEKTRLGFMGIGMLGKPMSKRVLAAGYLLTFYDIQTEPMDELVREGAKKASSAKKIAKVIDVIITSLRSLALCEEVYVGKEGLLTGSSKGQFWWKHARPPPGWRKNFG